MQQLSFKGIPIEHVDSLLQPDPDKYYFFKHPSLLNDEQKEFMARLLAACVVEKKESDDEGNTILFCTKGQQASIDIVKPKEDNVSS